MAAASHQHAHHDLRADDAGSPKPLYRGRFGGTAGIWAGLNIMALRAGQDMGLIRNFDGAIGKWRTQDFAAPGRVSCRLYPEGFGSGQA